MSHSGNGSSSAPVCSERQHQLSELGKLNSPIWRYTLKPMVEFTFPLIEPTDSFSELDNIVMETSTLSVVKILVRMIIGICMRDPRYAQV